MNHIEERDPLGLEENINNYLRIDFEMYYWTSYDSIALNFMNDKLRESSREIIDYSGLYMNQPIMTPAKFQYLINKYSTFSYIEKIKLFHYIFIKLMTDIYNNFIQEYFIVKNQLEKFSDFLDLCYEIGIPISLFLYPDIIISTLRNKNGEINKELSTNLVNIYNKYILPIVRKEHYNIRNQTEPESHTGIDNNDIKDIMVQYSLGGDFSRRKKDPFGFSKTKFKKGSPKRSKKIRKKSR